MAAKSDDFTLMDYASTSIVTIALPGKLTERKTTVVTPYHFPQTTTTTIHVPGSLVQDHSLVFCTKISAKQQKPPTHI